MADGLALSWRNPAGTVYSAEPELRVLSQRPMGPALRLQSVPGGDSGYAVSRPPIDLHVLILSHRIRPTCYETTLGGSRRNVTATTDGYSLLPAGSDSTFRGKQPGNQYAIAVLPTDWLETLARKHDLRGGEPPGAIGERHPSLAALSASLRAAVADRMATPGYLDHWMVLAGLTVLRLKRPDPRLQHDRTPRLTPAMLDRVLERMRSALDEEISLEELANLVGLSPWHFARCFRAATGWPPHAFITHLRLERAKTLLRQGRLGLSAVAQACGFASQSHFTTAFRRETGATPGRWRQLVGALARD